MCVNKGKVQYYKGSIQETRHQKYFFHDVVVSTIDIICIKGD